MVYLPETVEVIAVLGFGNEGSYGEIHKVRILRVVNIPTIIDFIGKKSKATSEGAKQKERVVEALACPNCTRWTNQILGEELKNDGSIYIVMEWWVF